MLKPLIGIAILFVILTAIAIAYDYWMAWREMRDTRVSDCPHTGEGEGDWCYVCWTNVVTGESYPE